MFSKMDTFTIPKCVKFRKNYAVLAEHVYKVYTDNVPVLRDFSMHVEQGTIYGLIGSSGCGKTTVLSCIVGLKDVDYGKISLLNDNVKNGVSPGNVGYMPQEVALYDQLTVTEMMKYFAKLHPMSSRNFREQLTVLENLLDLPGYGSRRITTLSGGEQRRVSLALTLLHSPKLLILDEPTVGLDPLLRENIWTYLHNLSSAHNTTIIITTHYTEEVKHFHKVGIMRNGTLIAEDNPSLLMQSHGATRMEQVVFKISQMDQFGQKTQFQSTPIVCESENKNICRKQWNDEKIGIDKKISTTLSESVQRSLAYSQVVYKNFLRHPIFIFLVLFLPPFQLFTTGIVVGVEPKEIPLGIVNHEILNWQTNGNCSQVLSNNTCQLSNLSCDLINHFASGIYLTPLEFLSVDEAYKAVSRGNIRGYIEIPGNYSAHVVERAIAGLFPETESIDGSLVKLHLDQSEYVTTYVVLKELYKSFTNFIRDRSTSCNFTDFRRIEIPFLYRDPPVYGDMDGSARDYTISPLIVGILFEVAFSVTPLILINDMNLGTLERSQVAGLKFMELMAGLFISMASLSVIQAFICLVSIEYGLGFHVQGSIFTFVCLCLATAFCCGALGLLVGIWSKDGAVVVITVVLIIPALMVNVGALRPFEVTPHPYRDLIFYLFPSASIMKPFNWVMNRGVSFLHPMVWPGILVTLGWGLVFAIICPFLIRVSK